MKNLKKVALLAMFGMMCFGGYSVYEYIETSNAEFLMMENVEALTQREGTATGSCARRSGPSGSFGSRMFCDSRTTGSMIYPCPTSPSDDYYISGNMDRCTN